MTFWQEAFWQFKRVWTNPWWYIALLLFVWGPFAHYGTEFGEYPWWAWIYMPLMVPTIFFMALLSKRCKVR